MRIGLFFREHMWVRTLTTLSLVIFLVMGAMIALSIKSQNEMIRKQVNHQGEVLAAAIEGGMNDALSIGNNDLVRQQFTQLKVKMPDIEVAVCDFNQIVSFATDQNLIKKPLGAMVKSEANAKAISRTLANAELLSEPFEKKWTGPPASASSDRFSTKAAAIIVMEALEKCWEGYWSGPPPRRHSMPSRPPVTGRY